MRRTDGTFDKGYTYRNKKPFWSKAWMLSEYVLLGRTASEIASEFGVTDNNIYYWLGKHGIKRRTVSETRAIKRWGATGKDNPMFGKTGDKNPNWKGGISPERQAFYESAEWKAAVREVWKRDNATCQRCRIHRSDSSIPFHIHHIVSFQVVELRTELSNLVLLCKACHDWVHSLENVDGVYIQQI